MTKALGFGYDIDLHPHDIYRVYYMACLFCNIYIAYYMHFLSCKLFLKLHLDKPLCRQVSQLLDSIHRLMAHIVDDADRSIVLYTI